MGLALRVSVGANLALLVAAGILLRRDGDRTASPSPGLDAAPAQTTHALRQPTATQHSATSALLAPLEDHHASVLTPTVIAHLEDKGIPRSFLIEVVLQNFSRRWDERMAALEKKYAPRPVPPREYLELQRLRDAEQVREMKAALGEERYLAWDKEQTLAVVNGGGLELEASEAERIYRLQKQHEANARELQMAMEDGVADKADVGTLQAQAHEAFEAELERLLGRTRYEQLRGLSSPVADAHRMFPDLNLSDEQAHAIAGIETDFRAREAALMRRLNESPADAAAIDAELKALTATREENLRQTIGAEAYERAKRETDSTYQTLKQYAAAWQLQDADITPVYDSLKAFHEHAQRTREAAQLSEAAGQDVDWKSIEAAIETARQKTEAGLLGLLGGERLHRLKQNGLLSTRD